MSPVNILNEQQVQLQDPKAKLNLAKARFKKWAIEITKIKDTIMDAMRSGDIVYGVSGASR